jgi:hypothetical protein
MHTHKHKFPNIRLYYGLCKRNFKRAGEISRYLNGEGCVRVDIHVFLSTLRATQSCGSADRQQTTRPLVGCQPEFIALIIESQGWRTAHTAQTGTFRVTCISSAELKSGSGEWGGGLLIQTTPTIRKTQL